VTPTRVRPCWRIRGSGDDDSGVLSCWLAFGWHAAALPPLLPPALPARGHPPCVPLKTAQDRFIAVLLGLPPRIWHLSHPRVEGLLHGRGECSCPFLYGHLSGCAPVVARPGHTTAVVRSSYLCPHSLDGWRRSVPCYVGSCVGDLVVSGLGGDILVCMPLPPPPPITRRSAAQPCRCVQSLRGTTGCLFLCPCAPHSHVVPLWNLTWLCCGAGWVGRAGPGPLSSCRMHCSLCHYACTLEGWAPRFFVVP